MITRLNSSNSHYLESLYFCHSNCEDFSLSFYCRPLEAICLPLALSVNRIYLRALKNQISFLQIEAVLFDLIECFEGQSCPTAIKRKKLSCWPTRDHIEWSIRNSNPVMTSSKGGAKGFLDHRFHASSAYTAQLLTFHRHRANNQYWTAIQI